jgi:hypothetical protein
VSEPLERLAEHRQTSEEAFEDPRTGEVRSAFALGPPPVDLWIVTRGRSEGFSVLYHPKLGEPIFHDWSSYPQAETH